MIRTCRLAAASVMLWSVLITGAYACNLTGVGAEANGGGAAAPGDGGTFNVVGMEPGATYTVSIEGQQVAGGTASGPQEHGQFTMPDLGPRARSVQVTVYVEHPDIENPQPKTSWMQYEPSHAAPVSPQAAPSGDTGSQPQPTQSRTGTPAPPQPAQPAQPAAQQPSPPVMTGSAPSPRAEGASREPGARHSHTPSGSNASVPNRVGAAEPSPHFSGLGRSGQRPVAGAARAQPVAQTAGAPARAAAVPALGPRIRAHRAGRPVAAAADRALPVRGSVLAGQRNDYGPILATAAALLILVLMGAGGAGLAVRRRVPPPTAPAGDIRRPGGDHDGAIEAELQEMIAEQRASRLLAVPLERDGPRLEEASRR